MSKPILGKLKNGLTVLLAPCEAESVAFGLFVASGSRHEGAKERGISHFIEHMLFKGTPTRRPADITRAIEGRGGNFNAYTGEESTAYFAHLPNECLAEAVDILGDMYLHATIPEDEFLREREVIIEEIKMYDDEPDSVAAENLQRNLFPGHPLGFPVAGTAASLRAMKAGTLRRYIRTHYLPERTVAVVVGAFDPGEAMRLVAARFGSRRGGGAPVAPLRGWGDNPVAPQQSSSVTRDVSQAQLALGYRTFGLHDPRRYAATVMDAVLGRGMSSRLFQEVREKRGLSYDISSRMHFFSDAGMWTVSAGLDPAKREKALATVDRELKRICDVRVGAAELKRTKEFLIGNFRLSHEKITSKLFFYGTTYLAFGRLVEPIEQVEGVRIVTADDIRAVARAMLRPACRSVSWVLPNDAASCRVPGDGAGRRDPGDGAGRRDLGDAAACRVNEK